MTRLTKLLLNTRSGVTHSVCAWLVDGVVDLFNKFPVNLEGEAAYERPVARVTEGAWWRAGKREWLGIRFHAESHVRTWSVQLILLNFPWMIGTSLLEQHFVFPQA